MKKWSQIICGIVAALSLLFLLYGSMKFARLGSTPSLLDFDIDIPGVVVEQVSSLQEDKETIQAIVGTSLVTLIIGVTGFVISSRKDIEESR